MFEPPELTLDRAPGSTADIVRQLIASVALIALLLNRRCPWCR
jgi:hypothetical protein